MLYHLVEATLKTQTLTNVSVSIHFIVSYANEALEFLKCRVVVTLDTNYAGLLVSVKVHDVL